MKLTKLFGIALASITMLAGCNKATSENSGYDGRVFDISVAQDESITASLKKVGSNFEITISGEGEALSYTKKELVPWNAISKKISKVQINEGITNIGNYYFYSSTLDYYYIPSSVLKVEEFSFNASATIYSYSSEEIEFEAANKIYYYSEEAPSEKDKYWHKVGENPIIWDTYKVFFIGNSFTFYPHDNEFDTSNPAVANLTKNIATDLGLAVEVDFVVKGAHTLKKFADANDEMGAIVDEKLKANNDYDFVILQEQSTTPVDNYNAFNAGVTGLVKKVNETQQDCEVILYATWGFPSGVVAGSKFSSVSEMEQLIREAYIKCGDENNLRVNHVGEAFTYVYENHKEIALYGSDDKHQSYAGAYLSACVHVASLFNVDIRTSNFNGRLDATTASTLKEAAYNVVFN